MDKNKVIFLKLPQLSKRTHARSPNLLVKKKFLLNK